MTVMRMQMVDIPWLPLLSVAELLMSPVMKEDSCFLTVSFHILLMRLYTQKKKRGGEIEMEGKKSRRERGHRRIEAAAMKVGMKEQEVKEGDVMTKEGKKHGKKYNMRGFDVQMKGKLVQERH